MKNIKKLLVSLSHDELVIFLYKALWDILQYMGWVTLNDEKDTITVTNKGNAKLFQIARKLSSDEAEWVFTKTHYMPPNERTDAIILNIFFMKFIKLGWIEIMNDNRLEFKYRGIDRLERILERLDKS